MARLRSTFSARKVNCCLTLILRDSMISLVNIWVKADHALSVPSLLTRNRPFIRRRRELPCSTSMTSAFISLIHSINLTRSSSPVFTVVPCALRHVKASGARAGWLVCNTIVLQVLDYRRTNARTTTVLKCAFSRLVQTVDWVQPKNAGI